MGKTLLLAAGLLVLSGCRGLSREFNQALPEFMRADPGKEEMVIFEKIRKARDWTEEDISRQRELVQAARAEYDQSNFSLAADLFHDFLEQYPGSQFDEQVRYLEADAHFRDDSFEKAFRVFKDFTALYPVSDLSSKVMELEYRMGKDFLDGKRAIFFGIFVNRSTGEKLMTHIVESFPGGARAADAQWALGHFYLDEKDLPHAVAAFKFLSEHYRTSEWYAASLFYTGYARYLQVKGAVYDPGMMKDAREAFEVYLREVPEGAWRKDASEIAAELEELEARHVLGIGEWYVGEGREYSARYYFMNVIAIHPNTNAAVRAREALDRITPIDQPRTGEKPAAEPSK